MKARDLEIKRFVSLNLTGLFVIFFCFLAADNSLWGQNILTINNPYLQVNVNTQNGNMTILTIQGDPSKPSDDNLAITDPDDTAFILRLYNVPVDVEDNVVTYGTIDFDLRDGDKLDTAYYTLNVVERFPTMIRARWLVYVSDALGQLPSPENPTLVVERECTIIGNMVEIRIRVTNRSNFSRNIGFGAILDTGFNPPANATQDTPGNFAVSNFSGVIQYERAYTKIQGLPDFYFAFPLLPIGQLKGILNAGEGPLPNKVLFALVSNIQSALVGYGFDYTPNPYDALASADSAVGLYWDRLALPARGSVEVVTFLGVDIGPGDYRRPMSLRVIQPEPLQVLLGDDPFTPETEQAYVSPNPFTVTAFVYNSLADNPLTNVSVTLGLPQGLSFPPGETATKFLPSIGAGGEQKVSWQVQVNLPTVGVKELVVTAFTSQVGVRQVKAYVVVPSLPLRRQDGNLVLSLNLNSGLNLIGFPFFFVNPEPSVVLGILPEQIQLAAWDSIAQNYLYYRRDLQLNRLELGLGYWIRMPMAQSIDLPIQNILSLPTDQPVVVPIRRGWNLLSNPFPWQVLLRGEGVRFGSETLTITFDEAVARGWVKGAIFVWRNDPKIPPHGGEYSLIRLGPNLRIDPLQGFWLYSEIDGNIVFGPPASLGSWQIRGSQESLKTFQPNSGWAFQVTAISASGRDSTLWLGVSKDARNDFDRLDLPKVPPPPSSVQVSSVVRVGRSELPLSMDIRAPQGKILWNLELLNPSGGEVKLQFNGLVQIPRSVSLLLVDPETNQKWSLRSVSSVNISTQPQQPKRLQVVALQTDQLPLRVQRLKVTPLRGRGAHIQFAVTMPAQVQIQIRSLTGRIIWEKSEQVSSQLCSVFWNGRSKSDEALPLGIYTVVIYAETDDGRQTQAQTILRLR
ncbi:MAG: hypothetical protein NZ937_00395 [Armatimonadetes bacterium]|nr:hypothetical protein [Armatimonadota bacterium]